MPYVDIPSRDDYVSIWYITNSVYGNVGSFDPDKPTAIILHPLFLDSTWLEHQFDDPRLTYNYNLIAFDMRVCGKSRCRPSGLHDSWVEAADMAFACQALCLPPAHVLALESISVNCALRLAALFPELCLSLTLCNVPPPTELKAVFEAYDELLQLWCYAEDLDSFEHAGSEVVNFMTAGNDTELDLRDELISYWEMTLPPTKRLRIVELINVVMNRAPMKAKELASITHPVLIIQGERSIIAPLIYAETLKQGLVNAKDPHIFVVKGATACLTLVPSSASILNKVFFKYLSSLPPTRSDLRPPANIPERMQMALAKLADIAGDPSIANRDPRSTLSFSCVTPEIARSQLESLKFYAKDMDKAYCPLGLDGRPMRKYSERKEQHWFYPGRDGLSCISPDLAAAQIKFTSHYAEPEPSLPLPMMPQTQSELVTTELAQDGRIRRTTFNPSSVDKYVIKGSMSKVVASTGVSLPKIMS